GSELANLLPQFKRWYSQAGTPRVQASGAYDMDAKRYTLTLSQSCPATPGQPSKEPFVIPVALGLLYADGREVAGSARTVVLHEPQMTVTFEGVESAPVPSLLRGFSAPVILEYDYTDAELLTLLANDTDPFNRWEAGQRLALK